MKLPEIDNLKELLSIPKNISIITHTNPDGDAIGSSLALYSYLKAKGNKVDVIVPNDFPDFLAWMPNVLRTNPGCPDAFLFLSGQKKNWEGKEN